MSNPDPNSPAPKYGSSSTDPLLAASETTLCLGLGGLSAAELVDEEGFKTPTDLDHRVPEARPCPPAPHKRTAHLKTPLKRKNLPEDAAWMDQGRRISLLLDLSIELESMYPAKITRKIKKARTV